MNMKTRKKLVMALTLLLLLSSCGSNAGRNAGMETDTETQTETIVDTVEMSRDDIPEGTFVQRRGYRFSIYRL